MNPEMDATRTGITIPGLNAYEVSINVSNHAPNIVGIPSRSERYIASAFFIPKYRPTINVIPDLDTPGTKAIACAKPITRACFEFIFLNRTSSVSLFFIESS